MKNKRLVSIIFASFSLFTLCVTSLDGQYLNKGKQPKNVMVHHKAPKKYKHYPYYGKVVKKIPASHSVIVMSDKKYYFDGAVFYKPLRNDFVVCAAPIGVRIGTLPLSHSVIVFEGSTYYYNYGVFYRKSVYLDGYEVVKPFAGMRVDALPSGCTMKVIDGVEYFIIENTYYRPVVDVNGGLMFEVVSSSS